MNVCGACSLTRHVMAVNIRACSIPISDWRALTGSRQHSRHDVTVDIGQAKVTARVTVD
jgi:hypothetical protein